jgi:fibronectin type 3 domain-containing protein
VGSATSTTTTTSSGTTTTTLTAPQLSAPTSSAQGTLLSWSAVTGATSYEVYRGTASQAETALASTVGTTYKDTPTNFGTTYYYEVIAFGASGNSPMSNEVSDLLPPPAPTLGVPTYTSSGISLRWSPALSATSYAIYRGTIPGQLSLYATTTSTSYTDTAIGGDVTYYYQIAGINASGTGVLSAIAIFL